jgi:hypothetical protein
VTPHHRTRHTSNLDRFQAKAMMMSAFFCRDTSDDWLVIFRW